MVRQTTLHCVLAFGFCGLYGSFAGAVVAKSTNGSSPSNLRNGIDGLETSQTRVNQVDGYRVTGSASDNHVSGKDYSSGSAGYPVDNSYGPPRDYYYDERPEYFSPYDQAGHHLQSSGPPPEVIYHQHPNPHLQHHQHGGGGGEVHNSGELNVQPLLWPLAGIALLGVLSALVKTPLLLQLGHIGRRRRRDANYGDGGIAAETIKSLLEKFNDKERRGSEQQECLVCNVVASIYHQKSTCVERSICEVMSRNGPGGSETDRRLLTATIAQVVGNDQIPKEFKKRLETAERSGRSGSNCGQLYRCSDGAPETVLK